MVIMYFIVREGRMEKMVFERDLFCDVEGVWSFSVTLGA